MSERIPEGSTRIQIIKDDDDIIFLAMLDDNDGVIAVTAMSEHEALRFAEKIVDIAAGDDGIGAVAGHA